MNYKIISTGSKGNAVVINGRLLVDCGVNFKQISEFVPKLQLVLLTHIHSDHFYPSTIKRLARERPTLRFGCCNWLVKPLINLGVQKWRIDVYSPGIQSRYNNKLKIEAFVLTHNVENCGYKVYIDGERLIYATDTNNLNGITAPNYDLYMIEANYEDEEIKKRIQEKEEAGEYAYEKSVLKNHLSKKKCDDFITRNAGIHSKFIYMHRHEGGEKNEH